MNSECTVKTAHTTHNTFMTSLEVKQPKFYAFCLAALEQKSVNHGTWIDATLEPNEMQQEIQAMLAQSPVKDANEWEIFGYEGFGDIFVDDPEYRNLEKISAIAKAIVEHGDAFIGYAEIYRKTDVKHFKSVYYKTYWSEAEFAEEFHTELGDIPENWKDFIDWDKVAEYLFSEQFYCWQGTDGVHIFCRW